MIISKFGKEHFLLHISAFFYFCNVFEAIIFVCKQIAKCKDVCFLCPDSIWTSINKIVHVLKSIKFLMKQIGLT